jgi:carbamoyltransferase
MLVLGLNAYHGDSAACVFLNGQLIAAAEEERFRRIKHWAGLRDVDAVPARELYCIACYAVVIGCARAPVLQFRRQANILRK